MTKRDAAVSRTWHSCAAAITVGAAVLLLMISLPTDDTIRLFFSTSLTGNNAIAGAAPAPADAEVLLDPPNLMVPVPADPAKTKAAAEALAAFRARMKKDFEEQWANLTPGEQAAMRKQWQEDWKQKQAEERRRKTERAARNKAATRGAAAGSSRRLL